MMLRLLVFVVALMQCLSGLSQPAQIIVIRHAEKPDDPENVHLSLKGRQRAMALVPYLTETPELAAHGLPAALFATSAQKLGRSLRPQETLEPLAKMLNLPLRTPFQNKEYELLARYVTTNADFRGKTVVICWVNEYMPELLESLGANNLSRKKWKSGSFDRTYLIQYHNQNITFLDLPQKLLFGDSNR